MLQKVTIFDGGFGTELQKRGLKAGDIPEELNITNPEIISEIHKAYIDAGADYITTNSFGLNPLKLKESKYPIKDMVIAAINNAKKYANGQKIMFDIGPLGRLLKPLGDLSFDEAYEALGRLYYYQEI